ncbi:MAG: hypothetical protein KGV44_00845 [Flavobacteriaceae bacterium]|nr:hypothetical protein [Flavobacteriaceae bacterium]
MRKVEINKTELIKLAKKMVTNKELVCSYIKGTISKQTLTEKGIRLAKPL